MNNPLVARLHYCSLLAYCPKSTTQKGDNAKKVMRAIKNDLPIRTSRFGELFASELIAKFLKADPWEIFFADYFGEDNILVPVPRSSPIRKEALWPSFRIAWAMEQQKMGKVKVVIERVIPVAKSSLAPPDQRPTPTNHYESMAVTSKLNISPQTKIILVDDIITRGHTFMGAAWCLKRAFPEAEIKAFAAMRTVSNEAEFKGLIDPVRGQITYRHEFDDCLRRP